MKKPIQRFEAQYERFQNAGDVASMTFEAKSERAAVRIAASYAERQDIRLKHVYRLGCDVANTPTLEALVDIHNHAYVRINPEARLRNQQVHPIFQDVLAGMVTR